MLCLHEFCMPSSSPALTEMCSCPLRRCVVVVGMPYANPTDPELAQRMAYWDARSASQSSRPVACSVSCCTSAKALVGASTTGSTEGALCGSQLESTAQGGAGVLAVRGGWSGQQ
eukprot:scaffold149538_cov19-Tisochrysis_lutea.AAC.1